MSNDILPYAEEIGLTFFGDRYDFDDDINEDGILATEGSPPLGSEENRYQIEFNGTDSVPSLHTLACSESRET